MENTELSVKGVYKIEASSEAYKDAMSSRGDEEYVKGELSSLVLVEIEVRNADHRFDLGDFKQPHTAYVPYDESYLDIDTRQVMDSSPLHISDFVVAFFLHFFDHTQPLETPYGNLSLPLATVLPERLRWKEYIYWC
jgi:hypothetical protein